MHVLPWILIVIGVFVLLSWIAPVFRKPPAPKAPPPAAPEKPPVRNPTFPHGPQP